MCFNIRSFPGEASPLQHTTSMPVKIANFQWITHGSQVPRHRCCPPRRRNPFQFQVGTSTEGYLDDTKSARAQVDELELERRPAFGHVEIHAGVAGCWWSLKVPVQRGRKRRGGRGGRPRGRTRGRASGRTLLYLRMAGSICRRASIPRSPCRRRRCACPVSRMIHT